MVNPADDFDTKWEAAKVGLAFYTELMTALERQRQGMEEEKQLFDRLHKSGDIFFVPEALTNKVDGSGRSETERKPNSRIYEEVIIDNGKPMHLTDILDASLKRGLQLRGKQREDIQVRNALAGSKRFMNMGNNVWWVRGEPISHSASSPTQNGQVSLSDLDTT